MNTSPSHEFEHHPAPQHGGSLRAAIAAYGGTAESWLDLSTGINSLPWQPPADIRASLTSTLWGVLPHDDDGLIEAARAYYDAPSLLPVAGSQVAIQALPRLRPPGRVAIVSPTYAEHEYRWMRAGHRTMRINVRECPQAAACSDVDVLIVGNPNNPDGHRFHADELLQWHAQLAQRGGWLIVDEAFIDPTPSLSLATYSDRDGLIVLRSIGKFFGLAGARVGFVLATRPLLRPLADELGPWPIAAPSRAITAAALADRTWQHATRQRLETSSARLAALLRSYDLHASGGCALYQWVRTSNAENIHDALARSNIWVRCFKQPASLRFGLPASSQDWLRLSKALLQWRTARTGA